MAGDWEHDMVAAPLSLSIPHFRDQSQTEIRSLFFQAKNMSVV